MGSGTPVPKTLIGPLSVIVFIRTGLARRAHVLTLVLVVAATVRLATTMCVVRIWKNKQRTLNSSKGNTHSRRSVVKGEGATTPLTAASPHYLMLNRVPGDTIH